MFGQTAVFALATCGATGPVRRHHGRGGLAGCGATGPVRCHPVSGQVTYDGKPAAGVRVYLMPTSAPMVPVIPANPHAVTGPDGRFKLSTYADGDGAPEGGYQVVMI